MKTTLRLIRVSSLCFFTLTIWTTAILGQEGKVREEELLVAAREIITNARYCGLITLTGAGEPNVRTVDPFLPEENWVIWFSTNPRSRKVREIRRNPRVTLHYFDREAQAYVSYKGTARLVNDPKEKARRWKEEWKPYYPDRDKDYLLVEIKPSSMEVINISKGLMGDPVTWAPDVVRFGSKKFRP